MQLRRITNNPTFKIKWNYANDDNISNILYSNEIINLLSHDFCIDTNFCIETQQKRFITKKSSINILLDI